MNLLRKLSLYVALWLLITPLLLAFPGFTIAQTKIAFSTERHICHRACLVIPPHRLRHGKIDRDVRAFQPLRQLRGRQPSVRFMHNAPNLMPLLSRKCVYEPAHGSVSDQRNFHRLFKIHPLHQFNKPRLGAEVIPLWLNF